MKRLVILVGFLIGSSIGIALAQSPTSSQSSDQYQPGTSLAEYAKKMKQAGQPTTPPGAKPAKVFTNDDVELLKGKGGVYTTPIAIPAKVSSRPGAHGEKYFSGAYSKLMALKELHQRQLEILEKKKDQKETLFDTDPNKVLQQQFSRSDINKNVEEINAKKLQIEEDDQAIADLEAELQRDNGNPGWLRVNPSTVVDLSAPDTPPVEATNPVGKNPEAKNPDDKMKSKEYWQSRFKSARAKVAQAEEIQRLVEDEISMLKIQQARELAPDAQAAIAQKLEPKQTELETATAGTDSAKKALDDLQKEFAESGAPEDWSVTE
jgi:hypothetical protein